MHLIQYWTSAVVFFFFFFFFSDQLENINVLGCYNVKYLHVCLIIMNFLKYCICLKYSDREALANSVAQDQMLHNAASDQGLHCLLHIHQSFRQMNTYSNELLQISTSIVNR